jgi:hypothetical protein
MVDDRYVNRASGALKTQMDSAFERRLSVYSKAPVTVVCRRVGHTKDRHRHFAAFRVLSAQTDADLGTAAHA